MVTLKGDPLTLKGVLPEVGDSAPDFELVNSKLERLSLNAYEGKYKILNIFPSVDTGVCQKALKTFQERVIELNSQEFVLLHISKDLPFALSRFCLEEKQKGAQVLSAFDSSFGEDYGVLIEKGPMKGLFTRAVFLLDSQNRVRYYELVAELTQEPNYGQAFEYLESNLSKPS